MTTKIFPKETLQDILYGDTDGKVHDEIVDTSRWSIQHWMVFKADDGLHYAVSYSVGATEQQDETPFEFDPDEIECQRVELVEKVVTEWEPVK